MIPVFVTSFGRYEMLDKCLTSLRVFPALGPITVVDNTKNGNEFRQHAPWGLGLVPSDRPYIVCDEDIEIDPCCPWDLVDQLAYTSQFHPKVGLKIRTDNVPEVQRYAFSLRWERSLNARPIVDGVLPAEVDTHFAIYRSPIYPGICGVRLPAPYQCRHLPWYNEEFSAEEIDYYRRTGGEWARTHSAGELCTS